MSTFYQLHKRSRRIVLPALLAVLGLAGCKTTPQPLPPAAQTSLGSREYLVQATLWQQHASEFRALCYQAFFTARLQAADAMMRSRYAKPPAVVLDIDETVLDNSPYAGWQIKADQPFSPASWAEWTALANADTIPGARGFCKWAEGAGLDVFYVSNRMLKEREATIRNLQAKGFPNADTNHVLLRTDVGNKEPRRQKISETNTIIMLIGDNLNDLSEAFEGISNAERDALVERHRNSWGNNWIVLPNAGYGSWEAAMQGYQKGLNATQLDSIRKANIQSFK
jgi:5'-nucleotidase (lipoprotein e(P4) family)